MNRSLPTVSQDPTLSAASTILWHRGAVPAEATGLHLSDGYLQTYRGWGWQAGLSITEPTRSAWLTLALKVLVWCPRSGDLSRRRHSEPERKPRNATASQVSRYRLYCDCNPSFWSTTLPVSSWCVHSASLLAGSCRPSKFVVIIGSPLSWEWHGNGLPFIGSPWGFRLVCCGEAFSSGSWMAWQSHWQHIRQSH